MCGKDNENEIFPFTWSFLPSNSQWIYTFFVQSVPLIYPGTACLGLIKVNSNADAQETRTITGGVETKQRHYYINSLVDGNYNTRRKFIAHTVFSGGTLIPVYLNWTKMSADDPPTGDGDVSQPDLIQQLGSPSRSMFPNCQQGHCGFHRMDKKCVNNLKYTSILATERDKNNVCRVEVDVFIKWLWYFIKYYKNADEVELSMTLFNFTI